MSKFDLKRENLLFRGPEYHRRNGAQTTAWSTRAPSFQSQQGKCPPPSPQVQTSLLRDNCIKNLQIMPQRVTWAFSHSYLENRSGMRCLEKRNC